MSGFAGFPTDLPEFLSDLGKNNSKDWFAANRDRYEASYLGPAKAFVEAMAEPLAEFGSSFNADPRNNGSILRIHRDTRFSKDKSPYHTYLRIIFWQGSGKSRESTGLFFGIDSEGVFVGGGMHGFGPEQLSRYRSALDQPAKARALEAAINEAQACGHSLGEPHLKRVPKEVSANHLHAELFKYKGLYAGAHSAIEPWLFSSDIVETVMTHFRAARPLQAWLAEVVTP